MQSGVQDWPNLDVTRIEWLCMLYEWSLGPLSNAWAISSRLSNAESLQKLGLVEYQLGAPSSHTFPVRITRDGRECLEKYYPAELLTKLLRTSSVTGHVNASHAQNAAGKLIKKLPLEVAPMFLVHEYPAIREVGQILVEQANRA